MATYIWDVSICCPRSAGKVEAALKRTEGIEDCFLDFPGQKLQVASGLPGRRVKELAMAEADELSFPERKRAYRIAIGCPVCSKKVENRLSETDGISSVKLDFEKQSLELCTAYSDEYVKALAQEASDEIKFPEEGAAEEPCGESCPCQREAAKRSYRVEIDCAACAKKVEEHLSKVEGISDVTFDYPKGVLSLSTSLSDAEVIALSKEAEEDIEFLDHRTEKKSYRVSIDCAACAKKVEERLSKVNGIEDVRFDFPKGRLSLSTSLPDAEVIAHAKEAEDDIEFLDFKAVRKTYNVSIDCAACAKKVEEHLSKVDGISDVTFDYPKGQLRLTTSLPDAEVIAHAKEAEDDIEFLSEEIKAKRKVDYGLLRIIAAAAIFLISELSGLEWLAIVSWVTAGYDVLWKALKNITKGKVFDENFLMAVATLGALCIQAFDEAAAVMIFYQVGEFFQRKAVGASRKSIGDLMDLSADEASVLRDGEFRTIPSEEVELGETVKVKAGERLPLDGIVIEGETHLDMKALTGESVPLKVKAGDKVLSGAINEEGTILIRTTSVYADSTASKIMKLVDESQGKKAKSERFITRFSRYYTPFVCLSALLLALLPPLLGITDLKSSLYRACMLLVISCPCALVLSVPLTYFAAMGSFARRGILIRSDESIQNLSKLKILAMDKTGTLTEGRFSVRKVKALKGTEEELLSYAAALERSSNHPIATAILESCPEAPEADSVTELGGIGLSGLVGGSEIKVGNRRILDGTEEPEEDGTICFVSKDGEMLGYIVISDEVRENSRKAIEDLKALGVEKTVMLSGDRKERAEKTASVLGMDEAVGELLPQDKLRAFESVMVPGKVTAYAGDGINDAPTLARADVGIAMGGVGSDAAIEAADVVIMNDDPERIPVAMRIARKSEQIVWQNIVGSLIVKAVVFVLALFGLSTMWAAVFADTGVLILAVLNSLRALSWKD